MTDEIAPKMQAEDQKGKKIMGMVWLNDIRHQVVLPALGADVDDFDVDGIMSDLLDKYPLSEWIYDNPGFTHRDLSEQAFWDLVAKHEKSTEGIPGLGNTQPSGPEDRDWSKRF